MINTEEHQELEKIALDLYGKSFDDLCIPRKNILIKALKNDRLQTAKRQTG